MLCFKIWSKFFVYVGIELRLFFITFWILQLKVRRKIKCERNKEGKRKEKIKGKGEKSNFQNLEGVVTAWLTTDLESVKRFRAVMYCVFSRFQCFVLRSLLSSVLALCPQFYDTSCRASIQLLLPRWAK